ncbi:hypothetical protein AVEN_34676-1 [Araneus ventricosus]|uniref:Uncharacterized protein n=1 Tax=Araneus ventricosus TaxID=182803 RepID=A0A4Y2B105_ARAVE|nr:hypothetical protein AVEN_34676-1 [Araneus ventricosus]
MKPESFQQSVRNINLSLTTAPLRANAMVTIHAIPFKQLIHDLSIPRKSSGYQFVSFPTQPFPISSVNHTTQASPTTTTMHVLPLLSSLSNTNGYPYQLDIQPSSSILKVFTLTTDFDVERS